MIIRKAGRAIQVRTQEEEDRVLEETLKNLTPQESAMVLQIVNERLNGVDHTYRGLYGSIYEREPVSIRQFLEDDHYMGRACRTLYPKLKEHLINIVEGGYYTVIATGSTGIGKTYIGTLITCWVLYELSCLRNPQLTFGLGGSTTLYFVLLSKNLHLAKSVLLSAVVEKLKESPYFCTEFPFDEKPDRIEFTKNLTVQIGSVNSERVLGLAVVGFLMDETDFLGTSKHKPQIAGVVGQKLTVANYDSAERLYNKLTARVKSRFIGGGRLPGKAILLSSKTTTSSFTERRISELANVPDAYVIDHATWEVKPEGTFSGKTFQILIGSLTVRPRILKEGEVISKEFLDSTGTMVIDVPIEYRPEFERNLYESIRDTAGLSTDAISSFISDQGSLYEPTLCPELEHPFSKETWVLGKDFEVLWNELCVMVEERVGSRIERHWRPRRHPNAVRVIHIDPAISGDRMGIAMGHITRWVEVERYSPEKMRAYYEVAPEIEIDFCLQIAPQIGEYIQLSEIRGFIYSLRDHGFNIGRVTTDSYQSVDNIQNLRDQGINSDILSVDRDPVAYECLRDALHEGRMRMYKYPIFLDEMIKLERDPNTGKIDHPLAGSKDVGDAVSGVVASLEELALSMPTNMIVDVGRPEPEADWFVRPQAPNAPMKQLQAQLKKAKQEKKDESNAEIVSIAPVIPGLTQRERPKDASFKRKSESKDEAIKDSDFDLPFLA